MHYIHIKINIFLSQKWPENKIKYARTNSRIILNAKYILFHISLYVRLVFLKRCQLNEIDSTCITFEEKNNFLKKRFFQICEKSWFLAKNGCHFRTYRDKICKKKVSLSLIYAPPPWSWEKQFFYSIHPKRAEGNRLLK